MFKSDNECEEEEEAGSIVEDKLDLFACNINRYFRSPMNEQNSSRPNISQNMIGLLNLRGNQQYSRLPGNTWNNDRVVGEDSKREECIECHMYGHQAFEFATRLNRVRRETQSSYVMKATQNSTLSDEEFGEDSEKVVAFVAKVE